MSVSLLHLRQRDPIAFGNILARAKELASIQKLSKGEKAEAAERGQSQVDERLRLQMEWNRAMFAKPQDPNDVETWDFATLAMITMFQSQPHPEI
jgi:hypothetical protein